jgi:hypothetical protein
MGVSTGKCLLLTVLVLQKRHIIECVRTAPSQCCVRGLVLMLKALWNNKQLTTVWMPLKSFVTEASVT